MDLAGARGCGNDLAVDRITARIRRALEVLSVDSLSPTLQSSLTLSSPVLRSSVSDVTQLPVTLGNNPGFRVSLSFYFSAAQPFCAAFTHPISQQSPVDFISKSLSGSRHPVHLSVPELPHPALDPRRATLSCVAERGTQQIVIEGMRERDR